jgi:beta-lactamase class A
MKRLSKTAQDLSREIAPAVLGAELVNLESGENWSLAGDRPFPMLGLAVLPVAAAALAETDAGRLPLAETLTVRDVDLSPPPSGVSEAWPGRSAWSADELLTAAVVQGDATARDLLMKRIGGPGAVAAWLDAKRVEEVRVDRYWRQIVPDMLGLATFRAAWKGPAFPRAVEALPPTERAEPLARALTDPRDTTTPRSLLHLLGLLERGELLSPASRQRLLALMAQRRLTEGLADGLPRKARFAGAVTGPPPARGALLAAGAAGILTLADGRRYAWAAFLEGPEPRAGHARVLAELGRAFGRAAG